MASFFICLFIIAKGAHKFAFKS
uniref:Uncharacterized protein n=1 Tax=Anguilla anguilla TaxID=7936 RepID=A0A0E9V052_ANGAN